MMRLLHLFTHIWATVSFTAQNKYQQCIVCRKRRVLQEYHGCLEPADWHWVETGNAPLRSAGSYARLAVIALALVLFMIVLLFFR